jgi:SSS family solute:Na+ symporter
LPTTYGFKVFVVSVAIMAMVIAPLLAGQGSIFKYLQKMNGIYFILAFQFSLS